MLNLNNDMYTSTEKDGIRQAILKRATTLECRSMLTLAGPRGVDARMFASKFRTARVVSIESDADIFAKQQLELREYRNILCLNTTTSLFLNNMIQSFPDFDCVFLDYNGIYGKNIESDISSLFNSGKLRRNSVLGLTIAKGRDGIKHLRGTRLLSSTCCGNYTTYTKDREVAISSTICQISRDYKIDCSPILKASYRNSGNGMTMMAIVFNVINRR